MFSSESVTWRGTRRRDRFQCGEALFPEFPRSHWKDCRAFATVRWDVEANRVNEKERRKKQNLNT